MSLVSDIVDNIHLDHHFRGTKRRASYISGHALPIINVVDSDNVNSATTKGYVDKRLDKVSHSLKNYYTPAVDGVITDDDIGSNIAFIEPTTTQSVQIEPVSTDPGTGKAIIDNVVINDGDKLLLATQKNNVNGDKTHNGVFQVTSSGAVTTLNRIEFNHGDPIPHNIHVPVTGGDVFGNTVFSHMSPATPFPSSDEGAFETIDDFKTVGVDDLTFHKKGISDIHVLEGDNNGLAQISATRLAVNASETTVGASTKVSINTPDIVLTNNRITLIDGGLNSTLYYPSPDNNPNPTGTNEIRGLSTLGSDAGNLALSAGGNYSGQNKVQISLNGYAQNDIRFYVGNFRYSQEKMRIDDHGALFHHSTQANIVHKTRFVKSSVAVDDSVPDPSIGDNILTIEPTKLDVGENIIMAEDKIIKMTVEGNDTSTLLMSDNGRQVCFYSFDTGNNGLLIQGKPDHPTAPYSMQINNYVLPAGGYKPISINRTQSTYTVFGAAEDLSGLSGPNPNFISTGRSVFIAHDINTLVTTLILSLDGSGSTFYGNVDFQANLNITNTGNITSSDTTGKHVFAPMVGDVVTIASGAPSSSIMPTATSWQIKSGYTYSLIIQEFDASVTSITYGTTLPQGVRKYSLNFIDPSSNPVYVNSAYLGSTGLTYGALAATLDGNGNLLLLMSQTSGADIHFLPVIKREL